MSSSSVFIYLLCFSISKLHSWASPSDKMAAAALTSYILRSKFSRKVSTLVNPRNILRSECILVGHMPSHEVLVSLSLDYMFYHWGMGGVSKLVSGPVVRRGGNNCWKVQAKTNVHHIIPISYWYFSTSYF